MSQCGTLKSFDSPHCSQKPWLAAFLLGKIKMASVNLKPDTENPSKLR